jgi:putative holliday junction resolvase
MRVMPERTRHATSPSQPHAFPNPESRIPSPGLLLAFDYGARRIGVAVGDTITGKARALTALSQDWARIGHLLKEWKPAACIVGLPLAEDRGEQEMTRQAREFARILQQHFEGPVHLCDERYTTRSALAELRSARRAGTMKRKVRKGDRDSAAARLILEQWLADNENPPAR